MLANFLSFLMRLLFIAVFWAVVWRLIEPRSRVHRLVRAAVIAGGLVAALVALRFTGG